MRRTLALTLALPCTLVFVGASVAPEVDVATAPTSTVTASPASPSTPSIPPPRHDATGPNGAEGEDERSTPATAPAAEGTALTGDASSIPQEDSTPTVPVETSFLMASVPEAGAVAGTGRRWRYTVEVEPSLGIDPDTFAAEVRAALNDERSWARTRTLEQVADPSQARIRVVLATPATVDELCGRVGLRTTGIYSCWNGRFAALNSWRWESGADGFPDIATYRNYLVNHEFGHGLGFGHVGCSGEGELAPVMMQQSKGLGDCVANGWPYP